MLARLVKERKLCYYNPGDIFMNKIENNNETPETLKETIKSCDEELCLEINKKNLTSKQENNFKFVALQSQIDDLQDEVRKLRRRVVILYFAVSFLLCILW